ncbi:hypothetical protein [Candidatus Chlamydia sanziniae]|uniref:Uncharacterized protein n=1 Tax=Candidatus Chlamydia sanziniae TaxID=1806891 RepID=A0A1A9HVX9_9CHLA|nr:hypothetical protein [Candidatus Chlamydia sanziniae]ANH78995.1 hypothetical protein Cs308_0825 [Candidatus Chlamydia sanziniae]
MACYLYLSSPGMTSFDLDNMSKVKQACLITLDVLLAPLILVIVSIVIPFLLLIKIIYKTLTFLIAAIQAKYSGKMIPRAKAHFSSFTNQAKDTTDYYGLLYCIPIIGVIICIVLLTASYVENEGGRASCGSRMFIACAVPFVQLEHTVRAW